MNASIRETAPVDDESVKPVPENLIKSTTARCDNSESDRFIGPSIHSHKQPL